jgi:hypothetical protein
LTRRPFSCPSRLTRSNSKKSAVSVDASAAKSGPACPAEVSHGRAPTYAPASRHMRFPLRVLIPPRRGSIRCFPSAPALFSRPELVPSPHLTSSQESPSREHRRTRSTSVLVVSLSLRRGSEREMGRQPCCEKVGLKKGPWTAEEDQKLVAFLLSHGHCCWRLVPKLAGTPIKREQNWLSHALTLPEQLRRGRVCGVLTSHLLSRAGLLRCGKSCRLRWTNYLRPDLKRGLLSQEEEALVIDLHAQLGSRFVRTIRRDVSLAHRCVCARLAPAVAFFLQREADRTAPLVSFCAGGPRSRLGSPGGRTTRSRTTGTHTSRRSSGRWALTPSRTGRSAAEPNPVNP